ncbi:MAG: ABC transporter permease, partial [Lentisphaerota bacterium]
AFILTSLAGVLSATAPVLLAALGETLSERSGVMNLSINGAILLSAMTGFAAASGTGSLLLGFVAGMAVGAAVAMILAFSSIALRQSQVAVGFVLTMLCRDLAYFFGAPFMGQSGPRLDPSPLPGLCEIPFLGPLLFRQDVITYLSLALVPGLGWWIYRSRYGLLLRGIGERPEAAYARGVPVNRLRYVYTIAGGALVGLAGPAYSLNIKAGWKGAISGLDGIGWIVLAIVIFGGWNPWRVAFGCGLFTFLQWLGLILQDQFPGIPSQVLQVAPFPLMILTLLIVDVGDTEWMTRVLTLSPEPLKRWMIRLTRFFRSTPPAALGTPFEES